MNQGYTTLDQVVREACMEKDDNGMHNYSKFMLWAMECLQELRVDTFQEIKSIPVLSTTIATIPFPVDMVKWTKLGQVVGDRVKVFTINTGLTFNHDIECGADVPNSAYQTSYGAIANPKANTNITDDVYTFFGYGNSSGAIYGYGNGVQGDGQFRENRKMREFQLNTQYASTQFILEYVSTGLNPSGTSYVEESIRKAVKEYIFWMNTERNSRASLGEKDRAKYLYDMAERTVMRRNFLDINTIEAIVRKSYKQTPKA